MELSLQISLLVAVLLFLALIINDLRRGKLIFQYSLIWFVLAFMLLVCILVPELPFAAAALIGVEVPSNFVFLVEGLFVLLILVSLTAIVSKQRMHIIRLTQHMAIMEKRLRELEEKTK